jgi:hypothetical protein
MTEPPAAMEEEFNAWYDTEHMQERLAITGFRSARRWVADTAPGEGKYLATYELDSPGVLYTPEYLARLGSQTPWSQRCLGKCVVFRRWACEQTNPGDADPHPAAKALLFVCGDVPLKPYSVPEALQARAFAASSGEPRFISLFDLPKNAVARLPPVAAGTLVRLYRSYGP